MSSQLSRAASPYLRQHADQPVAWHAWGEVAFAEARRRDVPVMVSIGYATCHWCHVMAAESFSDPDIAARLNRTMVSVKVDREEHPEVDAVFLAAAAAFTPHLGWPLTVFTTPEGKPFFAGTYWPPTARGRLPGFADVIDAVDQAWRERREAVAETSGALQRALDAAARERGDEALDPAWPTAEVRAQLAARIAAREDLEFGGFAPAGADAATPKFPVWPVLRFLQTEPDEASRRLAQRTLDRMARSPLRDADGGFFRYATRRDWSVPHYERMLTDNAGLIQVALAAGRADIASAAAGFLVDSLQLPSGGFAAAQDSESWIDGERSEGGFYQRVLDERSGLEPPRIDDKLVSGWNGLAVGALAATGARLGRADLVDAAVRAALAVEESNLAADGTLRRASLDEILSGAPATLEDYGALAQGLAALAIATGCVAYAVQARRLVDLCWPTEEAAVVPGGRDRVLAALGAPEVDDADTDRPSGAASIAEASLTLWRLGAGERYRGRARTIVAARATRAVEDPFSHAAVLRVAALLESAGRQIVVVADSDDDPLARAAHATGADVVVRVSEADARAWSEAGFSLLTGRSAADGRPTAYDCREFVCRLPIHDANGFSELDV
ncbi:thioredoxin domain-containing protein [Microbacterium sp. SORGH_AS_0862]|uniref:thioredoxin domain-containing protein n=1 Tax=Microbacterium sp. SORGH_AS_0862 TaxID=3041789 RepID=UPI00279045F1|nr:DUF255 domain-containing protein [Microbacterium sp. SORGH_AS_0862]MDQ1206360.1 uncharacterized protein YyaL (SSP411 family) [Microbacterium sp. SORGH_AS_0862]